MAPEETPAEVVAPVATDIAAAPEPGQKLKGLVVAGGTTIPKGYDLVAVVEARTYKNATDTAPAEVSVKKTQYPAGADVYLRYDPEVRFPADAKEVLTMGVDLQQFSFRGFTKLGGHVNVGPAHPAYAAANLLWQRGCTTIDIVGLTDDEKAKLRPAFDELPTHAAEPAQVSVSFS